MRETKLSCTVDGRPALAHHFEREVSGFRFWFGVLSLDSGADPMGLVGGLIALKFEDGRKGVAVALRSRYEFASGLCGPDDDLTVQALLKAGVSREPWENGLLAYTGVSELGAAPEPVTSQGHAA